MKDKSKAKRIVASDGLDVYYWVSGHRGLTKGFKVLHPGSSMNHSSLESLEKGLNERGHPTIVLDPRGTGNSDAPTKPEFYSLERYSGDLQGIVEQEGLEKPVFIGHSFGFMPTVDYVSKTSNAEQIAGICASYKFSETTGSKVLFHVFNRVFRYAEYAGSLMTRRNDGGCPDQSGLEGKSDFRVWLSIVDKPFRGIKANTVSGIEINKWDVSEQLQKIEVPMLLIYGTKDPMVKPYAGERISELVKGDCHVETIEGKHSLPMHQPQEVLDVLEKYV